MGSSDNIGVGEKEYIYETYKREKTMEVTDLNQI